MSGSRRKSEDEWRKQLTAEQYRIAREKGTERAFTGAYNDSKEPGVYSCACCGNELFRSDTKFDSGTGWPSFMTPVAAENVKTVVDASHGMRRTEVICAACDAHLGHVFPDGPGPERTRYCINSAVLKLEPESP
jgi:peptide-methionine (R)-S-oxide reductase